MAVHAAMALALVASGCGDDEDVRTNSDDGADSVTIGLRDYAFEDVPATVDTETTIMVVNRSSTEAHELTAFRLPDEEERSLDELRDLPPDELGALFQMAPPLALAAAPGENGEVLLGDGTLGEPGRYLLVCFIPTGADPDEVMAAMEAAVADPEEGPPMIDGGPPHMMAGMIAELRVTS
jgi:hypothetical protein